MLPRRDRIADLEHILRDWLSEPGITLVCGDWRAGSIMELLPEGRATLTRSRYPEPFSGVRDLNLPGQAHHLHVDLAKIERAVYTIAPSVCFGYRPSFEVHFTAASHRSLGETAPIAFAVSVRAPYAKSGERSPSLVRYFRKLVDHQARFPDSTQFRCEATPSGPRWDECWQEAIASLIEARGE